MAPNEEKITNGRYLPIVILVLLINLGFGNRLYKGCPIVRTTGSGKPYFFLGNVVLVSQLLGELAKLS